MHETAVLEFLRKLALLGLSVQDEDGMQWQAGLIENADLEACVEMCQNTDLANSIWDAVNANQISLIGLKRAFIALLEREEEYQSGTATVVYSAILCSQSCPILALFDRRLTSALLKSICHLSGHRKAKSTGNLPDGTRESAEAPTQDSLHKCGTILDSLARILHRFGLRDQPDIVRDIAETACEITSSRNVPDMLSQKAFSIFDCLLHPLHGVVRETAAMIMRALTAGVLGTQKSDQGAVQLKTHQQVRQAILQYLEALTRRSSDCKIGIAALIRHIMLKAPDRAEARSIASSAASRLLNHLSLPEQQHYLTFVACLSRSAKVSQRMSGVELAVTIFSTSDDPFLEVQRTDEAQSTPNVQLAQRHTNTSDTGSKAQPHTRQLQETSTNSMAASIGMTCIAILAQRSSDKSPAIRAKAISGLAALASSDLGQHQSTGRSTKLREALAQAKQVKLSGPFTGNTPTIMAPATVSPLHPDDQGATPMDTYTPGSARGIGASGAPFAQRKGGLYRQTLQAAFEAAQLAQKPDLELDCMLLLARRRCSDEKATVRRAGLQLLEVLLHIQMKGIGSTQPQSPTEEDIQTIANATADPLVSVRKAGMQAAASLVQELPNHQAVAKMWINSVLPLIRDVEASIQEAVLEQVDSLLFQKFAIIGQVGKFSTNGIETAFQQVAGMVSALGEPGSSARVSLKLAFGKLMTTKKIKGDKIAQGLQTILAVTGDSDSTASVKLGAWICLAEISTYSPKFVAWEFLKGEWELLQQAGHQNGPLLLECIANSAFNFPPEDAKILFETLVKGVEDFNLEPQAITAHLRALTELRGSDAQWTKTLMKLAEEILCLSVRQLRETDASQIHEAFSSSEKQKVVAAIFTVAKISLLGLSKAPHSVVTLIQALASERIRGNSRDIEIPAPVQAHAWMALGHICLVDEALAKKSIHTFVDNLTSAKSPAVRNNIMLALADMCIQYTALVDSHVQKLALCLGDPHELVRKQALALLANLLSKDFVKWRGVLFHQFTLSLVDESKAVRGLSEYLLRDMLSTKAPLLAYNHFVESVFVLNDCQPPQHDRMQLSQHSCTQFSQTSPISKAHSISGSTPESRDKRDTIYRALLTQMAPEHKFATAAKLCQDILGSFADGNFDLQHSPEVLRDSLCILASKEIKVSAAKVNAATEDDSDNPAAAAKGKVVSAMMRKHLVEGIVPVMVDLKRLLGAKRHPLLSQLMLTMRVLLKDHKSEIEDILVADRQLAKELLYDMRQDDIAQRNESGAQMAQPSQERPSHTDSDIRATNHASTGLLPSEDMPDRAEGNREAGIAAQQPNIMPNSGSANIHGGNSTRPPETPPAQSPSIGTRRHSRRGSLPAGTLSSTPLAAEILQEGNTPSQLPVRDRPPGSELLDRSSHKARTPAQLTHSGQRTVHKASRLSHVGLATPAQTPVLAAPGSRTATLVGTSPLTIPKMKSSNLAPRSCLKPANMLIDKAANLRLDAPTNFAKENKGPIVVSVPSPAQKGRQSWSIDTEVLKESISAVQNTPESAEAGLTKVARRQPSRLANKRKAAS